MKYPRLVKKINELCGITTGFIIFVISIILLFETFSRGFFKHPNIWPLPLTQYMVLWAAFIGSSYAFQEKGHVAVGFIRDIIGNKFGLAVKRFLAVISYLCCFFYTCILLNETYKALLLSLKYQRLTYQAWQISMTYLYAAVILGSILMMITLICIIIDLLGKGNHYLDI